MRRAMLLIACLAVVAGCGDDEAPTAAGGCPTAVMWEGGHYFAARHKRLPPPGAVLEGGATRPCRDGDVAREVELREVTGVPPAVAVYSSSTPGAVFLDPGYLVELPSHPLHRTFYGPLNRPLRRAVGKPCAFEGEILSVDKLIVDMRGEEQWITVDARTRVKGLRRDGLPYLRTGDRVRIKGKGCDEAVMLAQRIEPAA